MHEDRTRSIDPMMDIELLPVETLVLGPDQVEHAMQLGRSATHPPQQWQRYINALALFSFEQWLHQRMGEATLHTDQSSLQLSSEAAPLPTVCHLQVSGFRLCLIPITSQPEETIDLPKAVVESPQLVAHFYILVAIYEELAQATLYGFLRHDQVAAQLSTLQLDVDDTYPIPLVWFIPECDRLLLYLRCAAPETIPLTINGQQLIVSSQPAMVPRTEASHSSQPAMNVGVWLQNQLDTLAQELSWMLLSPISLEMRSIKGHGIQLSSPEAGRSPTAELEALLQQLERNGMNLPPQLASAYRDWEWANIPLRLYAVTGALPNQQASPEWMLLLLLGAQPGAILPQDLVMRIRTDTEVVAEPRFPEASSDYLTAQVIGTRDEQFWVTITLPNGPTLTLPAFSFQLDNY